MDSEHRHDLEQNDLARFLENFGSWWAKWGNTVLIVLVIVVGSYTALNFYRSSVATAHEQRWSDLAGTSSPEGFRMVAQTYSDATVRALALLRGADLLLTQAMQPPEAPKAPKVPEAPQAPESPEPASTQSATQPAASSPAFDPVQALSDARTRYEEVLRDRELPMVYQLNARLGLATIAEAERRFDAAAEQYRLILEQREQYSFLAAQAQARLAMLDKLKQPVPLADEQVQLPSLLPASTTTPQTAESTVEVAPPAPTTAPALNP